MSGGIVIHNPRPGTLANLKAQSAGFAPSVYLEGREHSGDGGQGLFIWETGDHRTQVAADPNAGVYVPPNSDPMGASGCWVRAEASDGVYRPQWFASFNPATDDATAAIQACLDTAGANKVIYFPPGDYNVSATLRYQSGQIWRGVSGYQKLTGQTRIHFADHVTVGIEPLDATADITNVMVEGIAFIGGASTSPVIHWYRTSYGRLRDVFVAVTARNGVGILLDANTSNQCYFNVLDQVKSLGHVGIRCQNGANVNQIRGGRFGSGSGTGIEFLSLSTGNLVIGADFEDFSTEAVLCDAPQNSIVACHFEVAPIGIRITANGADTYHAGNTMATSVKTPVQIDGSPAFDAGHEVFNTAGGTRVRWSASLLRMQSDWFTTTTPWDFDALPFNETANSLFRFFLHTNTTGVRQLAVYKGDGTSKASIVLNAATGDITTIGTVSAAPQTVFDTGNSGPAIALTYTSARQQQKVTLTGNTTITLSGIPSGGKLRVYVYTGTGGFTVAWALSGLGTLRWLGGSAPTVTPTANKVDVFEFTYDGSNVIGEIVGQNG